MEMCTYKFMQRALASPGREDVLCLVSLVPSPVLVQSANQVPGIAVSLQGRANIVLA